MIKLDSPTSLRKPQEPTIALINIVFLMLIFFLIAGTLAPPLDPNVTLMDLESEQSEQGEQMPDALAVLSDGRLTYRGQPVSDAGVYARAALKRSADAGQSNKTIRLIPDRKLSAAKLLEITAKLQAAGAQQILLVAEKRQAQ